MSAAGAFESRDGLRLATVHQLLAAPRARIAIVHGYAEHSGRYEELLAELAARGYEGHAFDLRGHGASQGARGHVDDFADYRSDLDRFLERLPDEPERPLFLLGHSLGGLIALDYCLHRTGMFAGVVVSSPFLAPGFRV
ncbi:MAG TPA: alpha/beta fold hydrolase, partial [Thermoanaerobaculia bacterium]